MERNKAVIDNSRIAALENDLRSSIIGQDEAISTVTSAVKRAEMGFIDHTRPKGSFLMLGPTGVGKTELTQCVAKSLYDSTDRIVRFDMSEFQNQSSLSILLGSNHGDKGMLAEKIDELNEKGGGIVLLDEIEKAHKKLSTVFLGMLDAARFTPADGQTRNLSKCYLVFTSNLGAAATLNGANLPYTRLERHMLAEAERHFAPELFARFSEKVVFRALNHAAIIGIANLNIQRFTNQMEVQHGLELCPINDEVSRLIIATGYNRRYGARPMRNAVYRILGDALTELALTGQESRPVEFTVAAGRVNAHYQAQEQSQEKPEQDKAETATEPAVYVPRNITYIKQRARGNGVV